MYSLQEFFDSEGINIDATTYELRSFDFDLAPKNKSSISLKSYKLNDCRHWNIRECYDNKFNKKKCLCIAFADCMEYMWESANNLRAELNKHGYELFIADGYLIHGSIEDYKILTEDEIKEFVTKIDVDWFIFIQYDDKLICVIDDENYDAEGHWLDENELTCFIYNVNLRYNVNYILEHCRNKIEKHICNH